MNEIVILKRGSHALRDALALADTVPVMCYSLGNDFVGQPMPDRPVVKLVPDGPVVYGSRSQALAHHMEVIRRAHVTRTESRDGTPVFCLHVHDNCSYEWPARAVTP